MIPEEFKHLGPVLGSEKDGEELIFRCPKCHRPKFYVNHAKLAAHCMRCTFSKRFPRMIKKFARSLIPRKGVEEDQPISNTTPLISLANHPQAHWVYDWLEKRGVAPGTVEQDWSLREDGRLFIPVKENEKLMGWVARSIDGRTPKELHSPNLSHFLYGYDDATDFAYKGPARVILVEGIFDQIKIASFRTGECLALMGSHISDIQIGKLLALKPAKVIIMMDGDAAGMAATSKIAARLGRRMNPMKIFYVWLPAGKDPDDLTIEEFNKLTRGVL